MTPGMHPIRQLIGVCLRSLSQRQKQQRQENVNDALFQWYPPPDWSRRHTHALMKPPLAGRFFRAHFPCFENT